MPTPTDGEFAEALHSVAHEVVASGLADGLDLASGRRTRYFTAAGDDIVLDNALVRQIRSTLRDTPPACPPTWVARATTLQEIP
ncbi:hypothetical protein [Nocardioides sp. YIM 152315]|uniref:hypothetical protein n=1 Tax=Nocardioides sp. YIM 152315 TaxID=3031760 RepID=UPI0023DABD53|nr:hypothetical protein [Nocardioides sp. YIM 152315]MDF1606089.1 hypothetical protein [Nocardioides sp. YIM 152315]